MRKNWRSGHGERIPKRPARRVVLHIYDVTTEPQVSAVNSALRALGTGAGAYHAAIDLGRMRCRRRPHATFFGEWSFGGFGIGLQPPRKDEKHQYRESQDLGTTGLRSMEIYEVIASMEPDWQGDTYDLLEKNCCHFCKAFAERLGVGDAFPPWVFYYVFSNCI